MTRNPPPRPLQEPLPHGGAVRVRIAIALDPQLLSGHGEKKRAWGSTLATVQIFVQEFVSLYDPSSYSIQEAWDAKGKRYEASVVLPLV